MKYTWDGDEGRFWRDLRASFPVSTFQSHRCQSFPLNILVSSQDPGKAQHGLVIGGNVCVCRITWGWGCNGRSATLPILGTALCRVHTRLSQGLGQTSHMPHTAADTAFCRVHTYNVRVHPKSIYVSWVEHLLHRDGSARLVSLEVETVTPRWKQPPQTCLLLPGNIPSACHLSVQGKRWHIRLPTYSPHGFFRQTQEGQACGI